jgi:hypothetical protein
LDELKPSVACSPNTQPNAYPAAPPQAQPARQNSAFPSTFMGPLGYLMLGMTVAVVCFLAMHTFLK